MDTITIDSITYKLDCTTEIKIGDKVYNPLSGVIMTIDDDDDLSYVNDSYYLIADEKKDDPFTDYDKNIIKMLENKKDEMIMFLARYMSPNERHRLGEDIIRIMPGKGDIATIKLNEY